MKKNKCYFQLVHFSNGFLSIRAETSLRARPFRKKRTMIVREKVKIGALQALGPPAGFLVLAL